MKTHVVRRRTAMLAMALLTLTTIHASAQQASASAAPAAASGGDQGPAVPTQSWVKTCDNTKASSQPICLVIQDIRADNGSFIASITIRLLGSDDKKYGVMVTVPNGMLLKPGLKLQVDNATPAALHYLACDRRVCSGLGEVDDGFVAGMKGGKSLILTAYSSEGKARNFPMPLVGFATALASKGMSATDFQKYEQARFDQFKANAQQSRDAIVKGEQHGGSEDATPAQ